MAEEPILTYTDASLSRAQTLTLWPKKVHLKGRLFLRGDYEGSFPIEAISPNYQRVSMRDSVFWGNVWLFLISGGIAVLYHAIPGTTPDSQLGGFIAVLPIIAVFACLLTFRKVTLVQFLSPQGQLLFGLVKGGKEKDRFDEVVARLVEQIKNVELEPRAVSPYGGKEEPLIGNN